MAAFILPLAGTTAFASCTPPPSGIVAWWAGESNTVDAIGGNTGTPVGTVAYASGEVSQAFVFNGNQSLVTVGNPAALQLQSFTLEAWVKRSSSTLVTAPGGAGIIFGYGAGGYGLYLDDTGTPALSKIGVDQTKPAISITDTNFHHLAVTKAGSNVTFYVDGTAYPAPAYDPGFVFTTVAAIGGRGDNQDNSFLGLIDEVSVYNRALFSNEITAIYNAGAAGKCTPSLVGPTIISQPTNVAVTTGGTAMFTVTAQGSAPLTYQWTRNSTNLPAATNATLTLPSVQPPQAGTYSVIVSNMVSSVTSSNAVLTVNAVVLPPPSCVTAPSGIVAWWPGEGNGNDIIGNNTATTPPGLIYTNAEVGSGFGFDGGEYLQVADQPALNPTNALSIECWVYPYARPSGNWSQHLVSKDSECVGIRQYLLSIGESTVSPGAGDFRSAVGLPGGYQTFDGATVIVTNTWYHIAMTYDGAAIKIYVNGKLDGQLVASGPISTSSEPVRIGGGTHPGCSAYNFNGVIDEPSIYNRALSSNEIAAIFNAGSAGKCTPALVGPTITSQPSNLVVTAGNTASFTVGAQGPATLSYQWIHGNTNLPAATNATLILPNVQAAQAGFYSVLVSNLAGAITSSNALLTVNPISSLTCTPPPSGMVGWWPGEGNPNDIFGGDNGSLSATGAGYASAEVGTGFRFDGTNGYLSIPDATALKPANVTLEAWIWLDPNAAPGPSDESIFFKKNTRSYYFEGYSLLKAPLFNGDNTYSDRFQTAISSASGNQVYIYSTTVVQRGVWYHVASTYDGSKLTLYVNGVAESSTVAGFALDYGTKPVFVGASGEASPYSSYFDGLIDEASIYNRALTAGEIAAIYSAGAAGKCSSAPVVSTVPVIYNFTPAAGINGTVVTISGTNFSATAAANIVYFGAVQAAVLTANPTTLTVSVPSGATYAPITVTVAGLTAAAKAPFLPTFSGNGSGLSSASFGPRLDIPMFSGSGPGQTVIADLDGDGKPDVIVADVYKNTISIFRNISTNGTLTAGSFAPRVDIATTGGQYSPDVITVADVDGDGKLDIVATEFGDNVVSVFRNTSTPGNLTTNSFTNRVDFATGVQPQGVVVRDLDGDGKPEIVVANATDGTISIFQNTGTVGTLTTNSFAPKVDIATGAGCQRVAVGDLNGDGKPDLVAVNGNAGTISVLQNIISAPGTISAASFAPKIDLAVLSGSMEAAIVDVDGDGKLDLAVTAYLPQTFSLIQNLSSGGNLTANSFAPRIDYPLNGRGHTIAIGDFDGDGKPDLAVDTELNSLLNIFHNVSTPGTVTSNSLATQVELATGWNAWGVSVGDLDGDGRPDVVFANSYDNSISIYQNQVPFSGPPVAPTISLQPTNVTVLVNNTAMFTVTAGGTQPLGYQWYFNSNNISGATNASLVLNNVSPAQSGSYSVLVSNVAGFVLSSNAFLTVNVPAVPPQILSQTPGQVVLLGSAATFSVTASGTGPLNYFWSRNNVVIPGATNSAYTLFNAQLADSGGKFSCLVSNSYGFAASTNVTLKVIDTVSNDLCSGAVVITSYNYTNLQSTMKASSYGDPVPDCVDGFGNGVWYQFTSPVNGLLLVDTFGSDFDTGLGVYTGGCGSMTEVACNDDAVGVTSALSLPTTAGTTYYFLIGGYGGHVGTLAFHLNYLTPPAFDVQPANVSVIVSSNAVFTPSISGTQPIGLQWYFNNSPLTDGGRISGSTNATLAIAGVTTNDGGNYFLVASNVVGVTTSSIAVLTPVILPPVFIVAPVGQSIPLGSNVTFSAMVDGTPPYNFQWYFNGTPLVDNGRINGSATPSLTVSNLTTADNGTYLLAVTNVSGSVSASATLIVLVPPSLTLQPVGRSVPPGLPTIFSAAASGNPSPVYQWQLNGTNLPGATQANYTNPAVGLADLGYYDVVCSNAAGVTLSANAQLTFGPVAAWGRNFVGESLPPPGLTNVVGLAGSYQASFAIRADGTITSWGSGSVTNVPAGATNVVALATAGDAFTAVALRANGTVIGWGAQIPTLSNIVAVAEGGANFGIALRAEGTLVSWGVISYAPPAGLNHITAIAAGYNHALALRSDGTVIAWGTGPAANVPAGLAGITSITAGANLSFAVRSNGTVVAWGSGAGTNLPSAAAGLTNITTLSASTFPDNLDLCLALRADGRIFTWGNNTYGESNQPPALKSLYSVAIAAAPYHGLALVSDGSAQIIQPPVGLTTFTGRAVTLRGAAVGAAPLAYQWLLNGAPLSGATNNSLVLPNIQLTDAGSYQLSVSNSINTATSLPAAVNVLSNTPLTILSQNTAGATNYQASKISIGGITVLGSGPLRYQWFFNPSPTSSKISVPVSGATNDTLVFDPALAAQSGSYYLTVTNTISNSAGPAVSGVAATPVNVRVLFTRVWGYLAVTNLPVNVTNAIALATGGTQGNPTSDYFALGSDGKLTAWSSGFTQYGETNVAPLSNSIVTAIATSYEHTLALKSDGTVYAWGYNGYGQTNVPYNLNGVVAIACGGYHDLALKADGTVAGWGATIDNYGQATNNSAATNVVAIAAGNLQSLALRADGTVVAWGYNGDGSTTIPFGTTNLIAIAAGSGFSAGLRANGTVLEWGNNAFNYPPPST